MKNLFLLFLILPILIDSTTASEIVGGTNSGTGFWVDLNEDGSRVLVGKKNDAGNGITASIFKLSTADNLRFESSSTFEIIDGSKVVGQVRAIKRNDPEEDGTVLQGDANSFGGIGISISRDGNVIAIHEGDVSNNKVKIRRWTGSEYGNEKIIELNTNSSNATIDLDHDGDRIIIGCARCGVPGKKFAGYTEVYKFENEEWSILGGRFAGGSRSVSISSLGNIVAVGQETSDGRGVTSIYEYDADAPNDIKWNAIGTIYGEGNEYSGYIAKLSDDGKRVAIANMFSGTGSERGSVRIYDYIDTDNWTKSGEITGHSFADGANEDSMSLSGDGNTIALADEGDNQGSTCSHPGRVKTYRFNSNGSWWQEL